MKRIVLLLALAVLSAATASSQEMMDAILFLTGASAPEELDSDLVERFEALASRPVKINLAPESRLAACGLFSRYQAASLADYRRSSGDILSLQELALLDGFGAEVARALAPFVSFETRAQPGRASLEPGRVSGELVSRTQLQLVEGEGTASYALKARAGDEDRWILSAATKRSGTGLDGGAGSLRPETLSASAAVYGRKLPSKLVIGDFNARFGQGLLLWSGFSLSGVQSAAAMAKHPSGLSPAWTLSPGSAHRGAAADIAFGRFILSGFWSAGRCMGANLTWYARYGQLGLTAISGGRIAMQEAAAGEGKTVSSGISGDWRWSVGKFDLFGEMALSSGSGAAGGAAGAFVAGAAWNPAYQVRLAASVRSYPAAYAAALAGALRSGSRASDERAAALALDYKKLTLTVDAAAHPDKGTSQFKSILKYSPQLAAWLSLSVRAVSRFRPMDANPWRNELRAETVLGSKEDGFSLKSCASLCRAGNVSWLAYIEPGYRKEKGYNRFQFYLRATAFKADSWEDRIYIYERDVPGAFSVPAYYGRGCAASAVAAVKRRHGTFGARAYATAYPGMAEKKPGKAGLKVYLQLTF